MSNLGWLVTLLFGELTLVVYASFPIRIPSQAGKQCPMTDSVLLAADAIRHIINPYEAICDCGGIHWTRVAYLNMSDTNQQCPKNWTLYNDDVRGCGRTTRGIHSTDSAYYSTNGLSYSRVCGRVLAYQRGVPDAFQPYIKQGQTSIDEQYVDGVSITHGQPGYRKHIWSFASAIFEERNINWEFTQ